METFFYSFFLKSLERVAVSLSSFQKNEKKNEKKYGFPIGEIVVS